MLTHTSETAIRALVYLALRNSQEPLTPNQIADEIDASASYLAKILRMLGKAGIVNARRGAQGGVVLARRPETVTLLHVMEACQGLLICNYCEALQGHSDPVCAFHEAMVEVQAAMRSVMTRWTLADLAARPGSVDNRLRCRIDLDPEAIQNAARGGRNGRHAHAARTDEPVGSRG